MCACIIAVGHALARQAKARGDGADDSEAAQGRAGACRQVENAPSCTTLADYLPRMAGFMEPSDVHCGWTAVWVPVYRLFAENKAMGLNELMSFVNLRCNIEVMVNFVSSLEDKEFTR